MVRAMPNVVRDPTLPSEGGTILVVEDNPGIRDVVEALFESEDLAVTAIGDGRAAVAWAEQHQPALVLLDLDLPELDGVSVASVLRARFGALLPILIFSADERAYAK